MPLYPYRCQCGHTLNRLRKYDQRDDPQTCPECGKPMERKATAHHAPPDGVYSYCPNIGNMERHARRAEQIAKREAAKRHGEYIPPVVTPE